MLRSVLDLLTQQMTGGTLLSEEQVVDAVGWLVDEHVPVGNKADFLSALACKGETVAEIAAFARELRARSIEPPIDTETRSREILDVCGTGGDRLNTFNISSTVAIIAASAGVAVAKHGNRAITSQSGSADVFEALGVRIELTPEEAACSLREHHFAFFFAPKYHPAFKHIAPARRLCAERGQRTIFNFLGPLLNPARPTAQLVGVPRAELCEPMARVLQSLGLRRGMVVCGSVGPAGAFPPLDFEPSNHRQKVRVIGLDGKQQGVMSVSDAFSLAEKSQAVPVTVAPHANPPVCRLVDSTSTQKSGADDPPEKKCLDELSTLGNNTIAEFYHERGFGISTLSPEQFPLQPAILADLGGADRETNAGIVRGILHGEERGPKRDAVLLNAAAALFVAGKSKSLLEGWDLAAALIDRGEASTKLEELVRVSRQ
jgi:anthranilate phosphoribosyltransferase